MFLHCTQQRSMLNFTCIPVRYAQRPVSKSVPIARHHTSSTRHNLSNGLHNSFRHWQASESDDSLYHGTRTTTVEW